MLPEVAIKEYQKLYKQTYGKELTLDEATTRANEFMNFFKIIYKPLKKNWLKNKSQ
jgi:hypothetical protein